MTTLKIVIYIIIIDFYISCNRNNSKDSFQAVSTTIINSSKNDTLYKDNNTIILKTQQSTDTLLKFRSSINDSAFKVQPQNIKLTKKLNFRNYEYRKMFITTITEGVEAKGVNFAGHYCFVYWGCGSPCKLSAVVDLTTGIVYNGPSSAIGYDYKKDSKIIVINPPGDSSGFYNKNIIWQQPAEYVWSGNTFNKK